MAFRVEGAATYEMEEFLMKTVKCVMKVLAALAAIAGAVYLIAAYGDKLVAWAKRVIGCCPWDEGMEEEAPAAEETPAEEAPVEEAPTAEEAPKPDSDINLTL